MELIDKLYFFDLINISDKNNDHTTLHSDISKYSKSFLIAVLGEDLYDQIIAENPVDGSTLLGAIYYGGKVTYQGQLFKWNGFVNADKLSPMSDYVFYEYTRLAWSHSGSTANTIPAPELAVVNGGFDKLVEVHNRIEKQIQSLYDFMYYSGNYEFVPYWKMLNLNILGI